MSFFNYTNKFFKLNPDQEEIINNNLDKFTQVGDLGWDKRIEKSTRDLDELIALKLNSKSFTFELEDIKSLLSYIRKLSNLNRAFTMLKKALIDNKLDLNELNKKIFNLYKSKNNEMMFIKNLIELKRLYSVGKALSSLIACYFDKDRYPHYTKKQWKVVTDIFQIPNWKDNFYIEGEQEFYNNLSIDEKRFLYKISILMHLKDYLATLNKSKFDFFTLNKFLWYLYKNRVSNDILKKVLKQWKIVLENFINIEEEDRYHFDIIKDIERMGRVKEKVLNFVQESEVNEDLFIDFWNELYSAMMGGSAKNVIKKNLNEEGMFEVQKVKETLKEMLESKNYDLKWEDKDHINGAQKTLWELYGILQNNIPIINNCSKTALKYLLQKEIKDDYYMIRDDIEEFKKIYLKEVGYVTGNPNTPENLKTSIYIEIDKLFNVVDKIKQEDIEDVKNQDVKRFYELVFELKDANIKKEINYWIFQSNPEKFDIENAMRELEKDVFIVNQYKDEIRKGDEVLFWLSGADAGIIGHGDILTDPEIIEQNPKAVKFVKDKDLNKKALRVWVSYNEIEPKILKVDLQEDFPDIREKMRIFKNPQGTNFPIDKEVMDFFKKNFIESIYSEISTVFDPGLSKGKVINNTELMEIFKVSNSGGMRRSHRTNSLVLISDHTKDLYGDRWEDEILLYTGMGLTGDQSLDYMQNKTLYESNINGINVFLFEVFEPRSYTYKGRVKLITDPYQEEQPDKNGNIRNAWIFPLQIIDKEPSIISPFSFIKKKNLSNNLIATNEIENLKNLILNKKQIILYGPPGTGKTYLARVLAQEIAKDWYEIIQFHPSYSYEDFIEWIEAIPSEDGNSVLFKPKPRIFRNLCEIASKNPQKNIVLIIDEINRGDLGRIFGELILGLEPDNRNLEIETPLSYSLGKLKIPENLYIIGTMNSLDRSIAIVDYALRRRFLFYLMMPSLKILEKWIEKTNLNLLEDLKQKILNLYSNVNIKITEDRKLGKHYQIGHTYFFVNSEKELRTRWNYMIKPLIEEYLNFNEEDLSDYNFDKLIRP